MLPNDHLTKVLYEEKIQKPKQHESYRFTYRPKRQFAIFLKALAEKLEPNLKLEGKLN